MSAPPDLISRGIRYWEEAKRMLRVKDPHLSRGLIGTKCVVDPSIPTACTDGVTIRYNPAFIAECGSMDAMVVIAHEIVHNALNHPFRMHGNFGPIAQKAADHVVNNILTILGLTPSKLPWVCDLKYRGWSYPAVLADLMKDEQQKPPPPPQPKPGQPQPGQSKDPGQAQAQATEDPGQCGSVIASPNPEKVTNSEKCIQGNALDGLMRALKGVGGLSALGDIPSRQPYKLDLGQWLDALMQQAVKARPMFDRPHSQYASSEIIMPRLGGVELGKIIVAVDSSGSVSNAAYSDMLGQIRDIVDKYQCKTLVICCDYEVQKILDTEMGEELPDKRYAKGGTSFKPPFVWIEENVSNPLALLYLTDCEGDYPDEEPNYPVAWVCYGKSYLTSYRPPFGEIFPVE